jgi:hypothetical protein
MMFFKVIDGQAIKQARILEKLHRQFAEEETIKISAMTIDDVSKSQIDSFKAQARVSFPVKPGAMFAQGLNVSESPTIVLTPNDSTEIVTEIGSRSYVYLDELIRMMQGKVSNERH